MALPVLEFPAAMAEASALALVDIQEFIYWRFSDKPYAKTDLDRSIRGLWRSDPRT
jgi:hypothetical protein